ncbi:phosphoenolpyruvate--protein phosphotransferase [Vulcanibacillus modesticaldus]|uniref:Phosphoenolpyruvate-protein phosphotransferase n=1 Tax=Vulcanibacillus modesticaldus TaxID=337097 RepID=A0A1D2YV52_9BACI|nr:phosphoenolpyruvate--protein phosphotransferase [Vulcanibacillus modesticaldus]OEF99588.1 phosphoenolpyruvate--protein phosphotransferase [Vulcanibacillus modesticaldus]
MSMKIEGIAASKGIAIARAYLLENSELMIKKRKIKDIDAEINILEKALEKTISDLEEIKNKANRELGEDKSRIFLAHQLVLKDPEFIKMVKDKIKKEHLNAEFAINEVATGFIKEFEKMKDHYFIERATDIYDVTKRVLSNILGRDYLDLRTISGEVIIVAKDLTPSETIQLDKKYIKGFVTDLGGITSHSSILARSMEIPAVVGVKDVFKKVTNNALLILDGNTGEVIVNPSTDVIREYQIKQKKYEQHKVMLRRLIDKPTITRDKHVVKLVANISSPDEVRDVIANGGEGIGLYRSEFLFLGAEKLPTEEEQFMAYKSVLQQMRGKPVVVRTLDIGGDKELSILNLPKELNPFLGFRAIRLTLDKQDIFRVHLRALLRASSYGNLKIMFPMIATLNELRQAKQILIEEKNKLVEEGGEVSDTIEVGMMIEIPSAAILADQFAKEVDFFSIGTNDLIQFMMAADRMNDKVSYLYQPYNPAILRLLDMVIKAAHKEGKWVGMCGEMAKDPIAIPLLLGMGLDDFSMSPSSILSVREQLATLSKAEAAKILDKVLSMATTDEVIKLVKDRFRILDY